MRGDSYAVQVGAGLGHYRSVKVTRVQFDDMPRAGWKKPESDRRLSDLVSVGVLTLVFPPELVDEVIAKAGRTERRSRALRRG